MWWLSSTLWGQTIISLVSLSFLHLNSEPLSGPLDATQAQDSAIRQLQFQPTADAAPLNLDHHPGKILILEFWDSRCPYATLELGELSALARDFDPARLEIVLISSAKDSPANTLWETTHNVPFASYIYTTTNLNLEKAALLGQTSYGIYLEQVPMTAVYSTSGQLIQSYVGFRQWSMHSVEEEIREMGGL